MMTKRLERQTMLALFCLLLIALWQMPLTRAQNQEGDSPNLYEDEDANNDPNVCNDSPDPNCDWVRGWFQAALNLEHITLETAQAAFPAMHVNDWLPQEERVARERNLQETIRLYEDPDPFNDPNLCFQSVDPNCDWIRGYFEALANFASLLEQLGITPSEQLQMQLQILEDWRTANRNRERARRTGEPVDGLIAVVFDCPPPLTAIDEGDGSFTCELVG